MTKLTREIKGVIDTQIKSDKAITYSRLIKTIAQKYGVQVSKTLISKRAKALKIEFRRGRKRIVSVEKRPTHSVFLDCAGSFFLKGAELETGILAAINQVLRPSIESAKAQKTLKLAQQINAILLYAPMFGLKTAQDIAGYSQRGLLYLTEQKALPSQEEIAQYLHFLVGQELLTLITKEVTKICAEALYIRINCTGQTFYLDGQCRTVWPTSKIPQSLNATLSRTKGYVKSTFQFPSLQHPLILQTCPGYTFLPPEMFNFIQCFNQVQKEPISRIAVFGNSGETLASWEGLKPKGKCYFIAPLNPWQYAQLQGTQIVKDFQQYHIGRENEIMSVADARINLFNPQRSANIKVRAALVKRKEEHLTLITNISQREQRYIRKIAEQYFFRWPDVKIKTYYDLLEAVHEEVPARSRSQANATPLLVTSYGQKFEDIFQHFLEHLHHYALSLFFPGEYKEEDLKSMCEKFYHQSGYLKIKQHCWEVILAPFSQKNLQKACQFACQKFNQSDLKFPTGKSLRIYLQ